MNNVIDMIGIFAVMQMLLTGLFGILIWVDLGKIYAALKDKEQGR